MNLNGNGFSLSDYVDVSLAPGSKVDDFLSSFGLSTKKEPAPAPAPTTTTVIRETIKKAAPMFDKKLLIGGAVLGSALLIFIAMRQK